MAFKKTGGRSVFVQPTGMPDLSGFQSLAKTYDDIAGIVFDIGSDIRENKLNDLIIEAEAEGKTAGATYDSEGNLVPLTNLSISDSIDSQVIGSNEKKSLKKSYTDAAIKTYTANISNEAYLSAQDVLSNNPNDPDAIRGALAGFLDGLENVPENVKQSVLPSITSHFVSAESQANAGMIAESRKQTEETNLENLRIIEQRLVALSVKGNDSGNPAQLAGSKKMREELMQDAEGSFEALRSLDYSETKIDALKSSIALSQVVGASKANVTRSYGINGFSSTLQMIADTRKSLLDNPDIDGDIVADTMTQELSRLEQIDRALKTETSETQTKNYAQALNNIEMRKLNSVEDVIKLDVSVSQETSLIQALRNRISGEKSTQASIAKKIRDGHKEDFDTAMLPFYDEFSSEDERYESSISINNQWKNGLIDASSYRTFQTQSNSFFVKKFKEAGDKSVAQLESYMSNFSITPEALQAITPDLESSGFVGTGKTATFTRTQWAKRIATYSDDLAKERERVTELIDARNALISGTADSSQIDLVANQDAYSLTRDDNGQTLFSLDPDIQEENFETVTTFAMQYGVLHPEAKKALGGLDNPAIEQDVFDSKIQLYFKIRDSLSNGTTLGGVTDLAMGDLHAEKIMFDNGIDPLDFETAAVVGMQRFQDLKTADTTNPQRRLTGVDVGNLLDENFSNAVKKEEFTSFITRMFTGQKDALARERKIIENLFNSAPSISGNYSDVVIGDERMRRAIELSLANKISTGAVVPKNLDSVISGIRNSLIEVSSDVGVSVDSDGNGYLTFGPWHSQASQEIGDVPLGMSTEEAVFEDVRFRVLSPDSFINQDLRELVESGDGIITLEANSGYGVNQTYTVQITDPDTERRYNAISDYRFDFSSSHLNKVYDLALKRVQNKTITTFMDNFAFMKKGIIKRRIQSIVGDLNNDANWYDFDQKENDFVALMELMQSINSSINPFAGIEADKKFDARDVVVLRDFLRGDLKQEEYTKQINEIYGNK